MGFEPMTFRNPIGDSDFFPILFMYVSTIPLKIINPHTATAANKMHCQWFSLIPNYGLKTFQFVILYTITTRQFFVCYCIQRIFGSTWQGPAPNQWLMSWTRGQSRWDFPYCPSRQNRYVLLLIGYVNIRRTHVPSIWILEHVHWTRSFDF